jgi:hypothetical protein
VPPGSQFLENSLSDFMQAVRKQPKVYWNAGILELRDPRTGTMEYWNDGTMGKSKTVKKEL